MAICELTGKGPVVKNRVSHSNIKTKSKSLANVQKKRLFSPSLDEFIALNVATSTIRSIEHVGGFEKFLLNQGEEFLSKRARLAKKRLKRRLATSKSNQVESLGVKPPGTKSPSKSRGE